jgi:selenide,water dikinase
MYGEDPSRLIEVQTIDYFRTFLDDPFLFGRIAAQHALSDLYAMQARPFSALALATVPYARASIQEAMLHEMLSGALATLQGAGVVLTGGHTTEGPELALGFAVTGFGEEDRLFRKGASRAGDRLILTKPLGTGALLAAWRQGQCRADWFEMMIQTMLQSNRGAAEVLARAGGFWAGWPYVRNARRGPTFRAHRSRSDPSPTGFSRCDEPRIPQLAA